MNQRDDLAGTLLLWCRCLSRVNEHLLVVCAHARIKEVLEAFRDVRVRDLAIRCRVGRMVQDVEAQVWSQRGVDLAGGGGTNPHDTAL